MVCCSQSATTNNDQFLCLKTVNCYAKNLANDFLLLGNWVITRYRTNVSVEGWGTSIEPVTKILTAISRSK